MRRCIPRAIQLVGLVVALSSPVTGAAQDLVCTDCHNPDGIPAPHDAGCRDTGCLESCHAINLETLAHQAGPGTPLTGDRTTTCNTCHNRPFDGVYHPYRINVSAGSSTLPGVVDLDQACGQCHGGGTAQASTTGDIAAGSAVLAVASPTGFVLGARVVIAGAGALEADGVTRADFESSIEAIAGDQLTLAGAALATVSSAAVRQNPTKNGALYRAKSTLGNVAKGMHDWAAVAYPVTFVASVNGLTVNVSAQVNCGAGITCPPFTYEWDWGDGTLYGTADPDTHTYATYATSAVTLTVRQAGLIVGSATRSVTPTPPAVTSSASATGLIVSVSAVVNCGVGVTCPSFVYDWDWGDGTAHGALNPDSHTYAAYGAKTITLTVSQAGRVLGTAARTVTLTAPDLPPTASGTCTWSANTWTMTVLDTSTDTDATPVQTVTVAWGDGSTSVGGPGATLSHVYSTPGTYTVTQKAIDTALKASTPVTCPSPATPTYFSISGTVYAKNGLTPLGSAAVAVKKGTATARLVYTASNGTFSAGSLKPDAYTLTVTKAGYTFAVPAAAIAVGPSSAGNVIKATGP